MTKRLPHVVPTPHYPTPRYPSHLEPNPLDEPYPVPFPGGEKLLTALLGAGALAGLGLAGFGQEASAPDSKAESPFRFSNTGLPYRTSPYGTGQPTRLSRELAREVIDRAFKEAGFELKEKVPILGEGLAFEATGFDPERKTGYLFADWENLDDDAFVRWLRPMEETRSIEDKVRAIAEQWPHDPPSEESREAREALELPPGSERDKRMRECIQHRHDRRLSLEEAKRLDEPKGKEGPFVAVISRYDPRLTIRHDPSIVKRYRSQLEEARGDPDRIEELYRQIERDQAQATLQRLEKEVREYIAWVRRQGVR
jgi:hypothetical protein